MKEKRDLVAGWTVLIVDDEPDSLEVAGRVLKYWGMNVHMAANGKEALGIVDKVMPTIILSDLSMPEMDGWELLHYLRDHPATHEIPVVALTAHAMLGDRDRAMKVGFDGYLTKPLSPRSFIDDLLEALTEQTVSRLAKPAISDHRQLVNQVSGPDKGNDNGQLARSRD